MSVSHISPVFSNMDCVKQKNKKKQCLNQILPSHSVATGQVLLFLKLLPPAAMCSIATSKYMSVTLFQLH